jgi:hypothetical protein
MRQFQISQNFPVILASKMVAIILVKRDFYLYLTNYDR